MDDVSARLGVDIGTARPVLLQQTSSQLPPVRCAFPPYETAVSTGMSIRSIDFDQRQLSHSVSDTATSTEYAPLKS